MRLFLDNNLPPRWAPALNALADRNEFHVTHLRDKFDPATADVEWLAALGAEGDWIIVSDDRRILKSPQERAAWRQSRLTGFFLGPGWNKLLLWEKTWRFVRYWHPIVRQARMVQPGAGFRIPLHWQGGKLEQVR